MTKIEKQEKENAELRAEVKNNEDLATVAYMQGAESQKKKAEKQLTKAKEIIKKLIEAIHVWDYKNLEHVEAKAEQFLKE